MRHVRGVAVTTNRQTQFDVDIENRRYRLMQGNLAAGSTVWNEIIPWKEFNPETSLATGEDCTGVADLNIGFNPNGSADTSSFICVRDSSGASRYMLVVNRINGSIRIR
ncbi:MAG: hypothetical protein GY771_14690 [bacterium]|nr:hypothetical protein [bacterium]